MWGDGTESEAKYRDRETTTMTGKLINVLFILTCALTPLSTTAADKSAVAAGKRAAPVGVGEVAPDFTLEDQDGRKHTLSAERGKRPVVLTFYRGYW
jgi:cytochrome oxidase Cu insertion factor (SCO1/SenC/PrrC family)